MDALCLEIVWRNPRLTDTGYVVPKPYVHRYCDVPLDTELVDTVTSIKLYESYANVDATLAVAPPIHWMLLRSA